LSQRAAGEYLGITFQQVQKYEQGTNRLSVAALVHLRDLYGVPLDSLIPGGGQAFPVSELSRQAARLVHDFEAIRCEKVRGYLARLVRCVAAELRAGSDRTRRDPPPNGASRP
jgi:transcriptional regulator with XRE-family HTH domain